MESPFGNMGAKAKVTNTPDPSSREMTAEIQFPGFRAVSMTLKDENSYMLPGEADKWKQITPLWHVKVDENAKASTQGEVKAFSAHNTPLQPSFADGIARVSFPDFSANVLTREDEEKVLKDWSGGPSPDWSEITKKTDAWQERYQQRNQSTTSNVPPSMKFGDRHIIPAEIMQREIMHECEQLRPPMQYEGKEPASAGEGFKEDPEEDEYYGMGKMARHKRMLDLLGIPPLSAAEEENLRTTI
ncbi:MAG: hypothetical protein Q9182_007286 [Xanthomendoza sp. 2 TL-2023]